VGPRTTIPGVLQTAASSPLPNIGELRRAVLEVGSNGFHLMWFANQGEDDLAFGARNLVNPFLLRETWLRRKLGSC